VLILLSTHVVLIHTHECGFSRRMNGIDLDKKNPIVDNGPPMIETTPEY